MSNFNKNNKFPLIKPKMIGIIFTNNLNYQCQRLNVKG